MIDDFWKMVWQLKSDKIVMLTNLVEMGAVIVRFFIKLFYTSTIIMSCIRFYPVLFLHQDNIITSVNRLHVEGLLKV